jgi:membrane dipeptidase
LGIEGAHALEGDLANLAALDEAGFRYIGLAHFIDNKAAGSAHGKDKHGLTELGRKVVREMEERRMIIDLAHASPRAMDEVLAMATRPVIVSHTGVKGTNKSTRNLSDAHVNAIAAGGGLIGIGYWDKAVGVLDDEGVAGKPSRERIVEAMKYVRDLVGIDHVALGSDFDGTVETPFDASELAALTQSLLDAGFGADEIRKIMGMNAIEFLKRNLPNP